MNRIPVQSSDIRSVGYEVESKTLEIEFISGGLYEYCSVPKTVYDGLMAASSKGAYFHQFIKDCYPFKRLR